MKAGQEALIGVLEEAKVLLTREGNDFAWSSFAGPEEAAAEIDRHIEKIRVGDHSKDSELTMLFAPTGPIQEVSLSSGWGDAFIKLASRFDDAFMRA